MKYILCFFLLLVLPFSAFADGDELGKLNSWKQTVQDQLAKNRGELGLWKQRMANTALASAGKSPIGFTHIVPGQDPTLVQGWRDPLTKGDAEDNFTEATMHIQMLGDNIKAAEDELTQIDKKIKALESPEASGGGGGKTGGGGGGGGY